MRCPADGAVASRVSWVLEVRILARLYEAHLLRGEGGPDRRHSWGQWTPPQKPLVAWASCSVWSCRPLSTGGREEKHFAQWRSQKEGVARMAGRAEKHRGGALPAGKGRAPSPLVGVGALPLLPPGHSRGETKGGQGMGHSTGDHSFWS